MWVNSCKYGLRCFILFYLFSFENMPPLSTLILFFPRIALAELLESLLHILLILPSCVQPILKWRYDCYFSRYFFTRNQTPKTTILIALLIYLFFLIVILIISRRKKLHTTYSTVRSWHLKKKGRYKLVYIMAV